MRRRKFLAVLGGVAATWPLAAFAQPAERRRRIGMLMNQAAGDQDSQARSGAFLQRLAELGWIAGRNVQIEYRWAAGDAERIRSYATELVALAPDVILATGGFGVAPLRQATRTVPIVFVNITDPVGQGLVESLARPGGNSTGFTLLEYASSGKWLELLKQIAPNLTRIAVVRELSTAAGSGQLGAIQAAAAALGVEISSIDVSDPAQIERNVTAFGRAPNGGLIVTASAPAAVHRGLIITLAARHRLPAVYFSRLFPTSGGLSSYGPDPIDQYRHAAGYVDRILKGENPADLPVQAPTKYEMVLNLKTAKALGLTVPPKLLYTADEVIE